jgi:hypothetical protein
VADPEDDDAPGFVVHIPVTATNPMSALELAHRISRLFTADPEVDVWGIAVSPDDDQSHRQHLYCDRLTGQDRRRRCGLRSGHFGGCVPRVDP